MQLPLELNLIHHLLNGSTVSGNLDDLMTTGFYYVQQPVNAPTSAWPHVFVNANENKTKVVQLVLPDKGSEGLHYRCYSDSKWGDWLKLAAPEDVANALQQATTSNTTANKAMELVTQLQSNIGVGSQWSKEGLTSLNGFDSRNLCWRKYKANGLTIVQFAGFCTTSTVKQYGTVDVVQVSDEIKSLIGLYFTECSTISTSPASSLTFDRNTGKITMRNGYNFDLNPFATNLSLLIVC